MLLYYAAGKKDAKLPATPDFAIAKYYSTEAAVRASKRTMDLMGGYGVINEYPVGRFLRDALASIPSGGTSHVHQLIIAETHYRHSKPSRADQRRNRKRRILMALKIVVCIKPVPDPDYYDKVSIDPVTKRITREGIPTIINPVDKNGIEAALKLKAQYGGKVTVLTMAPPNATENLKAAMAMGADEAVLLSDRAFGGADTLATSYTLAKGIEKLGGFEIVFCGTESADGATAQVSSQLGEWLGVPHLWNVFSLENRDERTLRVKTKAENGFMEWEVKLPCLLGVSRELNKPRFISAMGIIKAKNKPITTWAKQTLT
jgi:electron transfer flavoprotein beta subunit